MTAAELLQPLIARAMKAKRYNRTEATRRAVRWLAGELKVTPESLAVLSKADERFGRVIVNRYLRKSLPPLPPVCYEPMPASRWDEIRSAWGEPFFNAFFGEGECKAMLSPGQERHAEWSAMELVDAG